MTISETCGHHCGSANGREGHCSCPECSCPQAPHTPRDITLVSWGPVLNPPWPAAGVPICEHWPARASGEPTWSFEKLNA
jgi:hypothetical protein